MEQALTRKAPAELQINSITEWLQYAEIVCKTDVVPKEYKGKPADTFVAMQYGAEMGLKPLQALQSIAVINGKPSVYGDALPAIAFATGECEDFEEANTEEIARTLKGVCRIKRRGIPTIFEAEYSKEQAVKARLWTKSGPWTDHPFRMLQMRARAWAIRAAFPDKLKGVQMREEVDDYSNGEPAFAMPKRMSERQIEATRVEAPTEPAQDAPQSTNGASPISQDGPKCPKCGAPMNLKPAGKKKDGNPYPAFWSCSKYPECKGTVKDSDWQATRGNPAYSDQEPEPPEPGSNG